MAKKMETTIVYWGYIVIMEKRMEASICLRFRVKQKASEVYNSELRALHPRPLRRKKKKKKKKKNTNAQVSSAAQSVPPQRMSASHTLPEVKPHKERTEV